MEINDSRFNDAEECRNQMDSCVPDDRRYFNRYAVIYSAQTTRRMGPASDLWSFDSIPYADIKLKVVWDPFHCMLNYFFQYDSKSLNSILRVNKKSVCKICSEMEKGKHEEKCNLPAQAEDKSGDPVEVKP